MFKKPCIILCFLFSVALSISAQNGGSAPLQFVENKGQWDPQISYRAEMNNGAFFLHKNGFSVLLHDPKDLERMHRFHHGIYPAAVSPATVKNGFAEGANGDQVLHSHMYRVWFQNANANPTLVPEKAIETYNNYYIGRDPSKWASHCRIFQAVTYQNIYPNIDLRYYAENGMLKYNLIVHPGGNPDDIALHYDGVDRLTAKNKQLQIKTSLGVLRETIPASYQLSASNRTDVECQYMLSDKNTVKFKIKNYSPDATLVIDPTEIFCSFSGSRADNWGFTATYGPDGSMFISGIVSGNGYQVSTGAFQQSFAGGEQWDVGVLKFNSTGSSVLYGTYLGGQANEYPHSLVCDPQGQLVVFGRTESTNDFPLMPAGNRVGNCGGRDIFVTKFNASGTALIGSMMIGGQGDDGVNIQDQDECNTGCLGLNSLVRNYGDWSRGEVILDAANNIYVASCTQSAADFPIRGAVFQPTFGGGSQDGVIIKINPTCSGVIFSSFLGGSHDDVAFVMDLDPITNEIFVGGSTVSPDFPGIKANVLQSVKSDSIDGFVSRISNDGSTLIASTFVGTTGIDMVYGLKFDKFGYPYIMGTTTGSWPVVNAAWSNAGSKQFVSKLDSNLSKFIYSTTFGSVNASKPNISPVAFLVDQCENVYISGWGAFYDNSEPYDLQGTLGMPTQGPGILKSTTDNHDFYFIVIKRDASNILYGTFFGQNDNKHSSAEWCCSEHVDGGTSRYDKQGTIYEAICANCVDHNPALDFPTTPGARYTTNGAVNSGSGCNEAGVKIAFNFAGVSAGLKSLINGRPDTTGCVTLIPTLEDTVLNARSYIWDFGDGSPDTATISPKVNHAYGNTGTYLVRLIGIDSTSCNISDTTYIHIVARNDPANVAFEDVKLPPCQSLSYQFNNLSVAPAGKPFPNGDFIWDFGDGTQLMAGTGTVTHTFAAAGSYIVKLILPDTAYCNSPDTAYQTLNVSPLVKAQFIAPATGCAPDSVVFNNTSAGGQQFFWSFGDGTTSTDPSPGHLYADVGTYTVKLVVVDSNTCNIIDSTQATISLYSKPHAAFSDAPVPPAANTPTDFTNLSTGGVLFKWFFGDGDSAIRTNTDTVIHQYISTGTFQACLIVYNQYQCTDTACSAIQTIVNPLLDVPNAFTPGRFGENAVVKVRGYGITRLVFRIYNRWGQKVFESNDVNTGWDGTFKGNPQPMDVYAYTVEAEFFDGSTATKKGDITLIR